MLPVEIRETIRNLMEPSNRILILGIGENRMGDDGFGPYVSYKLIEHFSSTSFPHSVKFINGKTNYVERKQEVLEFSPNLLVIIDTCRPTTLIQDMPHRILIGREDELVNWLPLSSHVLPIPVFIMDLKASVKNLKPVLIGVIPISQEYKEEVAQYKPDRYSLDDYENNPDLPFYEFNLSPSIQKIADDLVDYLAEFFQKRF